MIGADSLGFLPVGSLGELAGNEGYCSACFDGSYPTEIPKDSGKNRFEQKISERQDADTSFESLEWKKATSSSLQMSSRR